MRKAIQLLAVFLLVTGLGWAQSRTESLGDAARRVRAARARKDLSRIPYFTNDNIPRASIAVSVLGHRRPATGTQTETGATPKDEGAAAQAGAQGEECDEQCWRGKFSAQREKIRTAERELDLLQREYNLARTQYYQDPNQAVREQYSNTTGGGRELQELLQRMEQTRLNIERYRREFSQLEDELRRAGGPAGWSRE
ncbi:MAG: hypothetical protein ACE5IP_01200 [Terriglobia bacterium]